MCGRYNITDNPAVHILLKELGIEIGPLPTRYNIAPTEPALTIIGGENPGIQDMRWWFTPSWSDGPSTKFSMFNARSETIKTSRAFKGAFKYRRGIVPASSFIEWQTTFHKDTAANKQPFVITNEESCLFLAAIWEVWNDELYSCAIVTTEASKTFSKLHKRQPVILSQQEAIDWIQADSKNEEALLQHLMQPKELDDFLCAPVEKGIGNSRNKAEPQLLNKLLPLKELL